MINEWLQKRREEAKAEDVNIGVEIGVERGEARGLSRAQNWYTRQQAALEKSEPFDEPPPWDEKLQD